MNECFQPKPYLPYEAIVIVIFEDFDISITDKVIKLRSTDTYNRSSLRRMGHISTDGVQRHIAEVYEEDSDSEGASQPIDRDQSRYPTQPI